MSDDDSQKISSGWYIAFFLLGILLGLWALNSFDVGGDIHTNQPSNSPAPAASAPKEAKAPRKRVEKQSVQPEPALQSSGGAAAPAETALPPVEIKEPLVCDQHRAAEVRNKAREVAEISVSGEQVNVVLRSEWTYYSDSVRRSFVEKFVDSDTCLNGTSRQISFFYAGKPFATARVGQGIVFE